MTPAEALYADLRARGIEFDTDGQRLRWRPAFLVSPRDARLIGHNRDQLVALVREGRQVRACPQCRKPLDSAGRCPGCFDRLCARCARLTGSYCIQLCFECGHLDGLGDATSTGPGTGAESPAGNTIRPNGQDLEWGGR